MSSAGVKINAAMLMFMHQQQPDASPAAQLVPSGAATASWP
eukprot:CAMPEP_0182816698 /NCGR_PEP_ID=MMETSP0006_2-20121128/11075_1 /TAXON_ID=97485 /ORGANISM="Prymnesium parvum, Strain Texoma1" /LENGTH=40 /DNA_ID= /DNA_START= /DNA_END= /DNA_ORIENTATION=